MTKRGPISQDEKLFRTKDVEDRAANGALRLPSAIKIVWQSLGLTQAEFAQKFKLTRRQVVDLENGNSNPTLGTIERISKPFGFVLGFVPSEIEE